MPTESTTRQSLVSRYASSLKDAIRYARSWTTRPQTTEYTRNLAKKVLSSESSECVEQVCTLIMDAAQRGTLEEAEAIGLTFAAIARAEWHRTHPAVDAAPLTIAEAHLLAERAEGECDEAEARMAHDPSVTNCLGYLAASARLSRAQHVLDEAVRMQVAAA